MPLLPCLGEESSGHGHAGNCCVPATSGTSGAFFGPTFIKTPALPFEPAEGVRGIYLKTLRSNGSNGSNGKADISWAGASRYFDSDVPASAGRATDG